MSSFRRLLGVWWVQLLLGITATGVGLAPWLFSGAVVAPKRAGLEHDVISLLPHAGAQPILFFSMLSVAVLCAGFILRWATGASVRLSILGGLGVLVALIAAGYQSWTVMEPASMPQSPALRAHLIATCTGILIALLCYWLLRRCSMTICALVVAVLSLGPGLWLRQWLEAGQMTEYLPFAGPLILGCVLGCVGFLSTGALLIWCAALALQWLVPGLLNVAGDAAGRAMAGEAVLPPAEVWATLCDNAVQMHWLYASLATLAMAMLLSVVLLVARRFRRR